MIPTRSRSALISQDSTAAPVPARAAFGSTAAPASAFGAGAPAPRVAKLSGFKLTKRKVDYIAVDQ